MIFLVVMRKDYVDTEGRSRSEIVEAYKEEYRKLGERIKQRFPHVEVKPPGPLALRVDTDEETAERIKQEFGCEVARGDTEVELIRPVERSI